MTKKIKDLFVQFACGLMRSYGIGYRVEARTTYHDLSEITDLEEHHALLNANENRIGYYGYNQSSVSILIAESNRPATPKHFTTQVAGQCAFDSPSPDRNPYKGEVTFNPDATSTGSILVTEYVLVKNR